MIGRDVRFRIKISWANMIEREMVFYMNDSRERGFSYVRCKYSRMIFPATNRCAQVIKNNTTKQGTGARFTF